MSPIQIQPKEKSVQPQAEPLYWTDLITLFWPHMILRSYMGTQANPFHLEFWVSA